MYCYNCMNEIKAEENYCFHCGKENKADTTAHHLKPGTILNNKFLIGNSIGEGGFGITYVGFDKNLNIRIAVKEYFPSGYANRNNSVSNNVSPNSPKQEEFFNAGKSKFLNEARSLAKFQNEQGIVQVRDFFEENNTAYIVMEYLDGTNLNDYIKSNGALEAEEVFKLMIPIMESLRKIHDIKLIHRDISPDNIMFLKSGKLKLMDFGSARYFSKENNNKSVMVKQGYAPIEQHQSDGNQGPWTDVYGLCATMYKCITGKTPVDSLERYMVDNLKKPSELGINITDPLERVLMYGLAVYHYNRCQNMTELLEITSKALNKQTVIFANENNNTAQNDIYKTQMADDAYKTQIADKNYDDNYNVIKNKTISNNVVKNKNSRLIIAVVITVCVMITTGSILFAIYIFGNSKQYNNHNQKNVIYASNISENNSTPTESTKEITTTTKIINTEKFSEEETTTKLNKYQTVPEETRQYTTYPDEVVDREVAQIREWYYSTQENPGACKNYNDKSVYTKDGDITKVVVFSGTDGWNYSREYYYHNGKLYFAFVFAGKEEHRMYFCDDILIRYVDATGKTINYEDNIICAFEEIVLNESYEVIED